MQTAEPPQRSQFHQAYRRAQEVHASLMTLRHGGTVKDVRARYTETYREPISREAVETALWHLLHLEKVNLNSQTDGKWWTANSAASSSC